MVNQTLHDKLFASPLGEISDFSFDEAVVRVFPDMLQRSIPGYQTIITQCGLLTEQFAQADSYLYDLGCSLGTSAFSMLQRLRVEGCKIVAVDNSAPMIDACRQNLQQVENPQGLKTRIDIRCDDISRVAIENASVVVLNFSLQFIPPEHRLALLQRIYAGMRWGGILVVSEKLEFADPRQARLHEQMYHRFKRANGYSDLEISQKRTALENVLIPDTLESHQKRFRDSGFDNMEVWFQCFNFASMVAIK